MERVLETLRSESEAGYSSAFVLTQNVHDLVYYDNPQQDRGTPFPVALARELSQGGRTCALYSISQGFRLFSGGQQVVSESDAAYEEFHRLTAHGPMVNTGTGYDSAQAVADRVQAPCDVLPALHPWLQHGDHTLIIDGGEYVVDVGHSGHGGSLGDRAVLDMLTTWARDPLLTGRVAVVLLCPNLGDVPGDLIRGDGCFRLCPVEYPNRDEREAFLKQMGLTGEELQRLANLTTGFRRADLREAVVRNFVADDKQVAARKAEIIVARCGDTVELVDAPFGLDISNAQPHVRDYLRDLTELIHRDRRSPSVPRGILFVGVPGNGKSHIAQAFAHDCGMNMLRFKNVRSMWVGQSERNLETVLDLLPSLAPCVVFVDEIDQMLGARSWGAGGGDAGSRVEQRLLGRLLEFMGDSRHRGDIIWIGATNRPDLLDIAAMRRFDRIFPFMNPTLSARADLINDIAKRTDIPLANGFNCDEAAGLMEEFSCDEVEKVMRRAHEIAAARGGRTEVTNEDVATARTAFKHNYNPLMHELIALLSIQAANFLSDLPWFDLAGRLREDAEFPKFLKQYFDEQGRPQNTKIAQRIADLQRSLGTG